MKVVINTCFGGFSLSRAGLKKYNQITGKTIDSSYDIPRDDKALVRVVEKMGEPSSGGYAKLKVIKIPNGVKWEISDCEGIECVVEKHRTWV